MNKTLAMSTMVATVLTLSACQSTPTSPVIQRANATYETTGLGVSKAKAQQNAIDSATKTCRGKQVIVINDKATYNGILDERSGRMIGQVGAVIGSVLGNKTPEISREDDYEYMMSFRCQ